MKELNSRRVFHWCGFLGKSSSLALCLIFHQHRSLPNEVGGTQKAVLRKQRLQSVEGTIISLCQSETLNWICSLNSLYNFVSHICSSVSVAWHLGHSNPDCRIIPFFPPFSPPPVCLSLFYFFFFSFFCLFHLLTAVPLTSSI